MGGPSTVSAAVLLGRCPKSAFSCGNGQCVTTVNPECDDRVDCSDGSDEAGCGQCTHGAGPGRSQARWELSVDAGWEWGREGGGCLPLARHAPAWP